MTARPVHFSPATTATVVKDEIVMHGVMRAEAFALLFEMIYAMLLDYPRKLINTFTFIQKQN